MCTHWRGRLSPVGSEHKGYVRTVIVEGDNEITWQLIVALGGVHQWTLDAAWFTLIKIIINNFTMLYKVSRIIVILYNVYKCQYHVNQLGSAMTVKYFDFIIP